jgi:hypothetical protein
MDINSLDGYMAATTPPINPYSKEEVAKKDRDWSWREEYRQFQADVAMAQYNQQIAENQLLLQRQWALEDRDADRAYNSPAAIRQRLEEAGYNPALMSGVMQAAQQPPTRAVQGHVSPGQVSNVAGIHGQKVANMIEAGKSLVSSVVSAKQVDVMKSTEALNRAGAIKNLSEAAFSESAKHRVDELLLHEKNALELDNYQKLFDLYIDTNYKEKQIITSLNEAAHRINLTDAQIQKIAFDVGNQSRLTDIEASRLRNDIKMTASNILKNKALIKEIALHLSLGDEELAQQKIRTEVQQATKGAQKAGVWVDMVSKGVGTIIGGALLGTGAGKVVQGLKKIPRVGFY